MVIRPERLSDTDLLERITAICRLKGKEDTEREVTTIDLEYAPDEYAYAYLNMKAGDTHDIEVKQKDGSWLPWHVECVVTGQAFLTHLETPRRDR